MTDLNQNAPPVSPEYRSNVRRYHQGAPEPFTRRAVILHMLSDHSPSRRARWEGPTGRGFVRPHVSVEYVPARRDKGSAGTGRWAR
jgi:hypothetical protein